MEATVRPRVNLLTEPQVETIVDQAIAVLGTVGVFVENQEALALLDGAGVRIADGRAYPSEAAIRGALATAPARVVVPDRDGRPALDLGGDDVHFDPGSAALWYLDPRTGRRRSPTVHDCVHLAWVTHACGNLAAQSTALVPGDVPEDLADRYRL